MEDAKVYLDANQKKLQFVRKWEKHFPNFQITKFCWTNSKGFAETYLFILHDDFSCLHGNGSISKIFWDGIFFWEMYSTRSPTQCFPELRLRVIIILQNEKKLKVIPPPKQLTESCREFVVLYRYNQSKIALIRLIMIFKVKGKKLLPVQAYSRSKIALIQCILSTMQMNSPKKKY